MPVETGSGVRWIESECAHKKSLYQPCTKCDELSDGARKLMAPAERVRTVKKRDR